MPVILPELPAPRMTAMSHAQRGLARSSDQLEAAAARVAAGTEVAIGVVGDPDAIVDLSPEASALLDGIKDALLQGKLAQHAYAANAAVVRAADEQAEELVRIPSRRA